MPIAPRSNDEGNTTTPNEDNTTPNEDTAPLWWSVLPAGFRWHIAPSGDETSIGTLASTFIGESAIAMEALRLWAEEHSLGVSVHRHDTTTDPYRAFPSRWYVFPSVEMMERHGHPPFSFDQESLNCPACGENHGLYYRRCPVSGVDLECRHCATRVVPLIEDDSSLWCEVCAGSCDDCTVPISPNYNLCEEHAEYRGSCGRCGQTLCVHIDDEDGLLSTAQFSALCVECHSRCCGNCGDFSSYALLWSREWDDYVCRSCLHEGITGHGEEEFDSSTDMTARDLLLPTIPGRESIRLCGVEIEGESGSLNDGGRALAEMFNAAGVSTTQEVTGYHHGNRSGFAHVERDASVTWEAVIGPINMAVSSDVFRLNRAVRAIRTLVRDGQYRLALSCGTHIHVSADQVSLDGAFNLHTLFCHVEDVVYRLAAAKWPVHRALTGSEYTNPVAKGLLNKRDFGREVGDPSEHGEGERYLALSFNNYFNSMLSRCQCGAVRYDTWDNCTCEMNKCTFEFRVFNATANTRKLHAYLALTQALVAKALQMPAIENPQAMYPVQAFLPKRFKDMTEPEQLEIHEEWKVRLEWLFSELPLTAEEKQSLRYCVVNSELVTLGDTFINTLAPDMQEVTA